MILNLLIAIGIAIVFYLILGLAVGLFWLGWRITKVPKHIWDANRKYPSDANFEQIIWYIKYG